MSLINLPLPKVMNGFYFLPIIMESSIAFGNIIGFWIMLYFRYCSVYFQAWPHLNLTTTLWADTSDRPLLKTGELKRTQIQLAKTTQLVKLWDLSLHSANTIWKSMPLSNKESRSTHPSCYTTWSDFLLHEVLCVLCYLVLFLMRPNWCISPGPSPGVKDHFHDNEGPACLWKNTCKTFIFFSCSRSHSYSWTPHVQPTV